MELIATSVVAPLVVGVVLMLIEYWVIAPTREQNISKVGGARNSSLFSSLALVSLGALVFTFTIAVMLTQIAAFQLPISASSIPYVSSVTFAAVIFICSALNYVSFYANGSTLSRFFTARILPPALAMLWGISFLQGQGWPFFFVLIFINIWTLAPLYANGHRTPLQIIVLATMLPINALSFVLAVTPSSEALGWFIAGFILICSLGFLGAEPTSVNTQQGGEVENSN